jgi:capsular polysaccharide biosynthesis protein
MAGEIDYFGTLRRQWMLAAAVFGATLLVTFIVTLLQRRVYESSAQLVVAPSASTTDAADVVRALETLERRTVVATFARMPSSTEARQAVAARLRLDAKTARRFRTHGSVVPNTNIIRIDAEGPDPDVAAAMANAAAELTAREAEALYRVYTLRFLVRATPAGAPIHPDRQRNFLVGVALGVFLAIAAALAAERLRRPPVVAGAGA